jgi:hypothetical protein
MKFNYFYISDLHQHSRGGIKPQKIILTHDYRSLATESEPQVHGALDGAPAGANGRENVQYGAVECVS